MQTTQSVDIASRLHKQYVGGARVVLGALAQAVGGMPRNVVDLGCGLGAWLAAAVELGAGSVLGLDLVPGRKLYGGPFLTADVSRVLDYSGVDPTPWVRLTQFNGDKSFDLALGLEVGEHLDGGVRSAAIYVSNLCRAADLVLFSAAVPGQGGEHHVNEQWPEYWARLFRERGYVVADPLRARLWHDERVLWWYRQNALVCYRKGSPWGSHLAKHVVEPVPALIHPLLFTRGRDTGRP